MLLLLQRVFVGPLKCNNKNKVPFQPQQWKYQICSSNWMGLGEEHNQRPKQDMFSDDQGLDKWPGKSYQLPWRYWSSQKLKLGRREQWTPARKTYQEFMFFYKCSRSCNKIRMLTSTWGLYLKKKTFLFVRSASTNGPTKNSVIPW